jgi:hypothetical protein
MSLNGIGNRNLVDLFLADEFAAIDPHLPAIIQLLNDRRAGQSWHKHGTFKDHLFGTYRALKLWEQPQEAALCALFHSVYSNEYVDLALFDPKDGRNVLRESLGKQAEETIHTFCEMPRTAFVVDLLEREHVPSQGMTLRRNDGKTFELSPHQIGTYLVVTVADLVEQWYSWQEDTMSGYPFTGQVPAKPLWSVTLWPGQLRPGSSILSLASRLARHLPDLDIPTPPIFGNCTKVLSKADEAAASALYWQVTMLSTPHVSPEHARNCLDKAVEHNPFIGEPYLLLAQIALIQDDFDAAYAYATAGLERCSEWGIPWDKRITWEGWVVWARLLQQRAARREWPQTLREHNNLGLVLPEVQSGKAIDAESLRAVC